MRRCRGGGRRPLPELTALAVIVATAVVVGVVATLLRTVLDSDGAAER